jgi:hypothetical protein
MFVELSISTAGKLQPLLIFNAVVVLIIVTSFSILKIVLVSCFYLFNFNYEKYIHYNFFFINNPYFSFWKTKLCN